MALVGSVVLVGGRLGCDALSCDAPRAAGADSTALAVLVQCMTGFTKAWKVCGDVHVKTMSK